MLAISGTSAFFGMVKVTGALKSLKMRSMFEKLPTRRFLGVVISRMLCGLAAARKMLPVESVSRVAARPLASLPALAVMCERPASRVDCTPPGVISLITAAASVEPGVRHHGCTLMLAARAARPVGNTEVTKLASDWKYVVPSE